MTLERNGAPLTIAIENKLKSAEHSSQLNRYDKYLAAYEPCEKLFLTLIEQRPYSSSAWRAVSYAELNRTRQHEAATPGNLLRDQAFVHDYTSMLSRLVRAVERVIRSPDEYAGNDAVFPYEVLEKRPMDFDDFASYVERLRLATVLQKAWMLELGSRVVVPGATLDWDVGETHRAAHLGFKVRELSYRKTRLDIGLQLQNRSFKVYCAPTGYRAGATRDTHRAVEGTLGTLRDNMGMPNARLSSTHGKGFRSFSIGGLAPHDTLRIEPWAEACSNALSTIGRAARNLG